MTTPGETAAPVEPSAPPDWATVTQDILCPLCDYNLRGLVEPRCPECGYEFSWQALFDDRAHEHPYLFEHHWRKNIRSFFRTLRASMLPRRFWRTLQPIHKPNTRRLLIYWLLATGMTTLLLTCSLLTPVIRLYALRAQMRRQTDQMIADPGAQAMIIKVYGSIQAYQIALGYNAPLPPLTDLIWSGLENEGDLGQAIIPCVIVWLAWPWLTLLSLFVFRTSLRQAKINNAHVLRCVLYSADGWLLAPPPLLAAFCLSGSYPGWIVFRLYIRLYAAAMYVIAIMLLVMTYRLVCAYRQYLRFHLAIATVVASQLIVLLIIVKLFFMLYGGFG